MDPDLLPAVLLIVVLSLGMGLGLAARSQPRLPVAALTLAGISALCLGAQLVWPDLLPALARERDAVLRGQIWRMVTALFMQDGGWQGGVVNLGGLLVLGTLAEFRWDRPRLLGVLLAGAVAGEIFGLAWTVTGAGTSILWCGLAGGLGGDRRGLAGFALLFAGALLLMLGDHHGAAVLAGALAQARRRRV